MHNIVYYNHKGLKKLKVFTIHVSYNTILNYKNISKLDKSELNFSLLDASRRNVLKVFMTSNFSKIMNLTAIGSFGILEYTFKYNWAICQHLMISILDNI